MVEKRALRPGNDSQIRGGLLDSHNRFMRAHGMEDPKDDAVRYMARYPTRSSTDPNDPRLGLPENDTLDHHLLDKHPWPAIFWLTSALCSL